MSLWSHTSKQTCSHFSCRSAAAIWNMSRKSLPLPSLQAKQGLRCLSIITPLKLRKCFLQSALQTDPKTSKTRVMTNTTARTALLYSVELSQKEGNKLETVELCKNKKPGLVFSQTQNSNDQLELKEPCYPASTNSLLHVQSCLLEPKCDRIMINLSIFLKEIFKVPLQLYSYVL